jgi:hypothetical protein
MNASFERLVRITLNRIRNPSASCSYATTTTTRASTTRLLEIAAIRMMLLGSIRIEMKRRTCIELVRSWQKVHLIVIVLIIMVVRRRLSVRFLEINQIGNISKQLQKQKKQKSIREKRHI